MIHKPFPGFVAGAKYHFRFSKNVDKLGVFFDQKLSGDW